MITVGFSRVIFGCQSWVCWQSSPDGIVIIHSSACVQHKDWLSTGWELLLKGAPYDRDYLLLDPITIVALRTRSLNT